MYPQAPVLLKREAADRRVRLLFLPDFLFAAKDGGGKSFS